VHSSTIVKIGFAESQRSFPIGYLYPQTTTERPSFVSKEAAGPITAALGQRVVIIGPDINNIQELIGNYGHVVDSGWVLQAGLALVQVCSSGASYGKWGYFNEASLCRSHQEAGVILTGRTG
jgi:hypothetical protein